MVGRHYLVEIKRIEKLALSVLRRPIIDRSRESQSQPD
jgi:hypothetical protein